MKVGIMAIGDELISGMTQDTNSSYIAREIVAEGWELSGMLIVGDDEEAIEKGLEYLMKRSDALIVTGGLGPTTDDRTTASIARAFGLELHMNDDILERMKKGFQAFGLPWNETNAKQALFPRGSEIIANPVGTACGFSIDHGDTIIAVIPGVPREVYRMLPEGVIPLFKRRFGEAERKRVRRTIKTFGVTEAEVAGKLGDLDGASLGVDIGFYPRFPENHIQLTAWGDTVEESRETLAAVESLIVQRLDRYIFGYDDDTIEGVVAALLTEKKLTLALAESCTGGLIADRLTNVPGSSLFLERGVVVYSNRSKTDLLGIPAEIIDRHGAVSEETAVAMAEGIRKRAGADIGIGVTGIAGPSGGTPEKPVGTVFIALADAEGTRCREFHFRWGRRRNKEMSSHVALELLRRLLQGVDIHG